ncbi:hypothetical protein M513_04913 [Trichuris suis]|uniref:Uncharacterized protein n=1 Tax=Trichuris suis TaxID=68888 RepID=A0A085MA90_9BILA|nr:hypothetical protein M513_04913 [Trichuris suis]
MLAAVLTILIVATTAAAAAPICELKISDGERQAIKASIRDYERQLKECVENKCGTEVNVIDRMTDPRYELEKHVSVECLRGCYLPTTPTRSTGAANKRVRNWPIRIGGDGRQKKSIKPVVYTWEKVLEYAGQKERIRELKEIIKRTEEMFESRKKAEAIG